MGKPKLDSDALYIEINNEYLRRKSSGDQNADAWYDQEMRKFISNRDTQPYED